MVPGVDVASEVDQPDIVALVCEEEAEAVVGEDKLGRGGLISMKVQYWRSSLQGYSEHDHSMTKRISLNSTRPVNSQYVAILSNNMMSFCSVATSFYQVNSGLLLFVSALSSQK